MSEKYENSLDVIHLPSITVSWSQFYSIISLLHFSKKKFLPFRLYVCIWIFLSFLSVSALLHLTLNTHLYTRERKSHEHFHFLLQSSKNKLKQRIFRRKISKDIFLPFNWLKNKRLILKQKIESLIILIHIS